MTYLPEETQKAIRMMRAASNSRNDARRLKKHLTDITRTVRNFILLLEAEMNQPSTFERGKRIAQITNRLEMANDAARHFGLGEKL